MVPARARHRAAASVAGGGRVNRYASRKFVAALLSLVSAHWGLLEGLLVGGDYKAVVLGTVGLYIAGNVAQKAVEKP